MGMLKSLLTTLTKDGLLSTLLAGAGSAIPFTYDTDTYWFSGDFSGNTKETTGDDTYSVVLERIRGVVLAQNPTKDEQPLVVTDGMDFNLDTDRELSLLPVTGITNGTDGLYLGAILTPETSASYIMTIARNVSSIPSRLEYYFNSNTEVGVKFANNDGGTPAWLSRVQGTGANVVSMGDIMVLELFLPMGSDAPLWWINGVAQTASFYSGAALDANYPATDPSEIILGNKSNGGGISFDGTFEDLILYNGTPSDELREGFSDYLVGQAFAPVLPVNTVAPAISGTEEEGQTLTCSTGTWTGEPTPTLTYQWERSGVNIGGETSNTYLLAAADVGETLTCVVTGTNTAGAVAAETAATGVITVASVTLPTDDANLEFWFSPRDGTTIDKTGNLVDVLRDKALGTTLATGSGSTRPDHGTRTINGEDVLEFANATAERLTMITGPVYTMAATDNTVFVIYETDDTARDQSLISSDQTGNDWHVRIDYDGTAAVRFSSGGEETHSVTKDTSPHLFVGRRTGTELRTGIDGASTTNANGLDTTLTGLVIIGRQNSGGSTALTGGLGDGFGYSDSLSLARLNAQAQAICDIYGITWVDWT